MTRFSSAAGTPGEATSEKKKRSRKPLLYAGLALAAGMLIAGIPGIVTTSSLTADLQAVNQTAEDLGHDLSTLEEENSELQSLVDDLNDGWKDVESAQKDLDKREEDLQEWDDEVTEREEAVTEEEQVKEANSFSSGVHRVGTDIKAGTYRNSGAGSCYWARLSGGSGELGDIIANDNPDGTSVVTISSSDWGFESKRCGEWALVD